MLKTPIGRFAVPGAIVRTNGSLKSYQLITISSLAETMRSVATARGSPLRSKDASITGIDTSAVGGKSMDSIAFWSQRVIAMLSL